MIYVGPYDFEVRERKKLDLLGETDANNCTIDIRAKQGRTSKQDTLVHELLHAIFWCSGYKVNWALPDRDEEEIISSLSPWILGALKDNPKLVDFLLET